MNEKVTTSLVFPDVDGMQKRIDELTKQVDKLKKLNKLHAELFEKSAHLAGFARVLLRSTKTYTIGEVAKIITDGGFEISTDTLFAWMREHGYLGCDIAENFNMPTSESMEKQLFVLKEKRRSNGSVTTVTSTVMVTATGLFHFVNTFLS